MVCMAKHDRSERRPMGHVDALSDSGLLQLSPQELAQFRQLMLTSLKQRLAAEFRNPTPRGPLDDRTPTQYNR